MAIWLFVVAALVLAMVVVGGATRLTDSGLSITEWKPIRGVIPPMNLAEWQEEFARYRQIPQYRALNAEMTLAGFQAIYWWEWAHRLLGRLVGAAFAIPFVVFLALRRLPLRLIWRSAVLLVLGGLQGLLGWWMVASGLSERISVAPERLAAHLGLALFLYIALIWTGLEAWSGAPRSAAENRLGRWAFAALGLAFLQSMLGALVAGNDAGLIYNDWPLMNGEVIPSAYAGQGLWSTLAHSQAAVQFNHRIGAYLLLALAVGVGIRAARDRFVAPETRNLALGLAGLVTLQAGLGIATLMSGVPLSLGLLHQLGAVIVLGVATAFAWRAQRP